MLVQAGTQGSTIQGCSYTGLHVGRVNSGYANRYCTQLTPLVQIPLLTIKLSIIKKFIIALSLFSDLLLTKLLLYTNHNKSRQKTL